MQTLLTLTAALTLQGGTDHWQVLASFGAYGPVEIEGSTATENAFQFTVAARPDGSLPMVQAHQANTYRGDDHITLLKKQASGKFALHAVLHPNIFRIAKESGFLLPPGDYAYHAPVVSGPPNQWHGAVLLSGRWATGATQNTMWQAQASLASSGIPLVGGGSAPGYRFTIEPRPDGKVAVLEQFTCQTATPYSVVTVYRKDATGLYALWFTGDMSLSRSESIAPLPPGDYGIRVTNGFWTLGNRNAIIATGRYVNP